MPRAPVARGIGVAGDVEPAQRRREQKGGKVNRSREVFLKTIAPQLGYNEGALRKMLASGSVTLPAGAVAYQVDVPRFDDFFTALSFGIVYKACGAPLPDDFVVSHVHHNFSSENEDPEAKQWEASMRSFYASAPMDVLNFGQVKALNATIYTAKIFGISNFRSSITIEHEFFGRFSVTSFLTKKPPAGLADPDHM